MSRALNLSGEWDGIFNYPRAMRPNAFQATLRHVGAALTGETSERSDSRADRGELLHGWLTGECRGGNVRFVKAYDGSSRAHYAITYLGTLDTEGREINGTWDIPGVWSGTFIMVRRAARQATAEQRAEETVR